MEKLFNRLMIIVFLVMLYGTLYLTVSNKSEDNKSFYENRYLENLIPFTFDAYTSGKYAQQAEKAFSDHIYRRDDILKAYTQLNRSLLKKDMVNRVVYGDGVLLPYYDSNGFDRAQADIDIDEMAKSLDKLNTLVNDNGGKLVFMAIPAQLTIFSDKYPSSTCSYAPKLDYVRENFFAKLAQRGVPYVDMKAVYDNINDKSDLYFATDHHFTCYGALIAYRQAIANLNEQSGDNIKAYSDSELEFKTLPNKFLGSLSRKIYDTYPNEDKLTICYPKETIPFDRYDNGEKVYSEVFKPPVADKYADYDCFMGIDRGEVVIDTHRPELPNVLIFGDSYTNAMETLLYNSFNKMYSLDCRYYKTKSVAQYIEEVKPDYVIYVRDDTIYLSKENNGDFFGENNGG